MRSYAVVGYSGGRAASLADKVIHFPVDDMQIAEDMQLILGHMITQWLWRNQSQAVSPADANVLFQQG
jgi:D-sedoheptulose 7-phosphate isomerase